MKKNKNENVLRSSLFNIQLYSLLITNINIDFTQLRLLLNFPQFYSNKD